MGMLKYKVCLCKGCIEQLKYDYYYTVPREELEIIEVDVTKCDNSNLDKYNEILSKRNKKYLEAPGYIMIQTRAGYYCESDSDASFTNDITNATHFTNFSAVMKLCDKYTMSAYRVIKENTREKYELVYQGKYCKSSPLGQIIIN